MARDFHERGAPDAQGGNGSACADGRGAGQMRERAQFADQAGRTQRGNGDDAASAVGGDDHLPHQDQRGVVARLSLDHENPTRIEGEDFSGFDEERNVGFGEVAEGARRPHGGAQPRGIDHVVYVGLGDCGPAASNSRTSRLRPSERR